MTRQLIVLFATALLIGYGATSDATVTHCVATGNQLNDALDLASHNGDHDIIKIEQGTLTTNRNAPQSPQWEFSPTNEEVSYGLTLSGGWSKGDNCAQQTSLNPAATVLDAQYWGPTLYLALYDFPTGRFSATIQISNLTLRDGQSFDQLAAGLDLYGYMAVGASVNFDNLYVTSSTSANGNTNPVSAVELQGHGFGFTRFRNSIVSGNTPARSAVNASFSGLATGLIHNNSIVGNQSSQGGPTTTNPGLSVSGIATLANNAVAGNSGPAIGTLAEFYSSTGSSLTLSNNHFGSHSIFGGTPVGLATTTTGDPKWTLSGILPVPDANSPLRDSGDNAPFGGIPSIDFRGSARIIAGTVDRGAIEAAAIPNIGPTVAPLAPAPGSTTTLASAVVGQITSTPLMFSASGGSGSGTTTVDCLPTAGSVHALGNASQVIAVGGSVQNISVQFLLANFTQTGSVRCTVITQGGISSQHTYHFDVPAGTAQGPALVDVSPSAGSTTGLTAIYTGEWVGSSILFASSGGTAGGTTSLNCSVATGTATMLGNGAQTIATGGAVAPVDFAFQASAAPQQARIDCVTVRQGVAGSTTRSYTFTLSAAVMLFEDSFD